MKKLLIFAFASLFILSACGKKADKASAEQSHESAAIQEVKSDNAQETKPAEAAAKMPRAEKADVDMTIDDITANIKWEKGNIDRFSFEYEVPAYMEKQPAPDNLDGATYVWKDLTYKVWGANDMHDGSAKAAFDQAVKLLGHATHENVVESDYYIISDFDEKNDIFYRKCVFNNALVYCEEVSYPQDYKTAVVPIVNKIASFRIADRQ